MRPTRPTTLAIVAVACALASWLLLKVVYQSLPPLPWTGVPALLVAAAAEAWTGRDLKARIARRRGLKPAAPLFVSRMVALAKASSVAAAVIAGLAVGFDLYLSGSLGATVPRQDAVTAGVTLAAAVLLACGALYLEHCCRVPNAPDHGKTDERARLRLSSRRPACEPLSWSTQPSGTPEDWNDMEPDISSAPDQGPGAGSSARHPARLKVGVIGAGRAGTALGAALARAGHAVVAVSAVSGASVRRARANFPGAVITSAGQVVRRADLTLLTVPDDVLPGLVTGLATTDAPLEGRMLAHASGRHGLAVLEPAARRGALPLALHPVMTFTGRGDDVDRLRGTCFGVTAPDGLRPAAEALVLEMGGEPVFIAEENRGLYHAAIAAASNHLITLVTQAGDLLVAAGVTRPARLLGPLLSASLDNALRFGDAGLTGAVARGDADTVAAHVAALQAAAPASPAVVDAYVAMARLTADRALAAGVLKPADAERLLDVLGGPREAP